MKIYMYVGMLVSLSACVISSTMDMFICSVRYLLCIYLRVVNYVVNCLQMYNKNKKINKATTTEPGNQKSTPIAMVTRKKLTVNGSSSKHVSL